MKKGKRNKELMLDFSLMIVAFYLYFNPFSIASPFSLVSSFASLLLSYLYLGHITS